MLMTLLSMFPIEQVTVDGEQVSFERVDELGHEAIRLGLSAPSQSVRTLTASVRGVAAPSSGYVVHSVLQPTVNPDAFTAPIRLAEGWTAEPDEAAEATDAPSNALTKENAGDRLRLALRVTRDHEALDLVRPPARNLLDRAEPEVREMCLAPGDIDAGGAKMLEYEPATALGGRAKGVLRF
jgi:hypothetical protein